MKVYKGDEKKMTNPQLLISGLLSLIFLCFIVFFSMFYGVHMMASLDQSTDLSGTPYEETNNASTTAIITSFSFMSFLPYILGITVVIFALMGMYKMTGL